MFLQVCNKKLGIQIEYFKKTRPFGIYVWVYFQLDLKHAPGDLQGAGFLPEMNLRF
jgi:hypothetical protein